ncbi:MAG TPA: bifunctional DNA primase/polymerase [Tepidisphaeraceae bacterium]|jgi:hypothetical protein|nr:bifunctional DNA primase/polymerase [Tepidisphaeraceae bacterium]
MSIYDEMLRAVAGGVSVVPICRTTKRPHRKLLPQVERPDPKTGQLKQSGTWKPFQAAIAAPEQLAKWRGAQAFAAVCGTISGRGQGGHLVLDFDERRFYDAWVTLVGELVGELADGLPDAERWHPRGDDLPEPGRLREAGVDVK